MVQIRRGVGAAWVQILLGVDPPYMVHRLLTSDNDCNKRIKQHIQISQGEFSNDSWGIWGFPPSTLWPSNLPDLTNLVLLLQSTTSKYGVRRHFLSFYICECVCNKKYASPVLLPPFWLLDLLPSSPPSLFLVVSFFLPSFVRPFDNPRLSTRASRQSL